LSTRLGTELNCTGGQCEQSVVFSNADILTRVKVCSSLTNKNFAGVNGLAIVTLYAKALCVGIATVTG
jgi:homoaconitase/3-isopropylmalate dehydratase large subunit